MHLEGWDRPDPFEIHHPTNDEQWSAVLTRYSGSVNDEPLRRCVAIARSAEAKTVVEETRYLDIDYRSEFQAHFSRAFSDMPDTTRRLHFFSSSLRREDLWDLPANAGYIGYVSIRPTPAGLVSRSMMTPPVELVGAIRTLVTETVHLFGNDLSVTAVPFAQQDAQLGACAHTSAWICHYTAHLRGRVARRTKAEFSLRSDDTMLPGRSAPTGGLTASQLSALFRDFDLPAEFYRVGSLPDPTLSWYVAPTPEEGRASGHWDYRIDPVVCRHLNSGNPVVVETSDHTRVICGYERVEDGVGGQRIRYVVQDDRKGPYIAIESAYDDEEPWRAFHVPLPAKLWLTPEAAEQKAATVLVSASKNVQRLVPGAVLESLPEMIDRGALALRTYAVDSNELKRRLSVDERGAQVVEAYRFARLPRYVWVVEAIDKDRRRGEDPCVVGEAVLDATSPDLRPLIILLLAHGRLWTTKPDHSTSLVEVGGPTVWRSGGIGAP